MLLKIAYSLQLRPSGRRFEREWWSSAMWHTTETPCSVRCVLGVESIFTPSASVSLLSLSFTTLMLQLPLHPLWLALLQHLPAFTSATCHSRTHMLPAIWNSHPIKQRPRVRYSGTSFHVLVIGRECTPPLQDLVQDSEHVPGAAGHPVGRHRRLGHTNHLRLAPEH